MGRHHAGVFVGDNESAGWFGGGPSASWCIPRPRRQRWSRSTASHRDPPSGSSRGRLGRCPPNRPRDCPRPRSASRGQHVVACARTRASSGSGRCAPGAPRASGRSAPDGPSSGRGSSTSGPKEALLADDPEVFFTTPHFDGYPAVLVRLERDRPRGALEEVIVEAWLSRAPKRLAQAYVDEHLS